MICFRQQEFSVAQRNHHWKDQVLREHFQHMQTAFGYQKGPGFKLKYCMHQINTQAKRNLRQKYLQTTKRPDKCRIVFVAIYELQKKKSMSLYGFKNPVIDMCTHPRKWSEHDLKSKPWVKNFTAPQMEALIFVNYQPEYWCIYIHISN